MIYCRFTTFYQNSDDKQFKKKKKINLASKLTAHSLFTKEMKVTENYSFKLTKKQMHCEYDYIHAKFKLVQFKRSKAAVPFYRHRWQYGPKMCLWGEEEHQQHHGGCYWW